MQTRLPILYSFRRCPYAMRARFALKLCKLDYELREVSLKAKPLAMLDISPKGTVPVLQLPDGTVIDESLDILTFAAGRTDKFSQWSKSHLLIEENDEQFTHDLQSYKYYERYPEQLQSTYRDSCIPFIDKLNCILQQSSYLEGALLSLTDIAIFPFIRQFVMVDEDWFYNSGFKSVANWFTGLLNEPCFISSMNKHPLWQPK